MMSVSAVTKVQYRIMLLEPNPGPIAHDPNQLRFLLDFVRFLMLCFFFCRFRIA
jgi:hypothetical protein